MNLRRIAVPAAAVLVLAAAASAQTYAGFDAQWASIRDNSRWRVGPFRLAPTIRLDRMGHDDNIYYSRPGEQAQGDYTAAVSPQVRAALLVGRSLILSVTENPEYIHYVRESRLRTFSNSITPFIRFRPLRALNFGLEYHDERHVRRILDEFGIQVRDARKGARATAAVESPRGAALTVSYGEDRFRYRSIDASVGAPEYWNTLDRTERTVTAEAGYPVFSDSRLFVTAGVSDYRFAREKSRWRDSRSRTVSGGISFPVAGRARGRISLGLKDFTPRDASRRRFTGLVADTDVEMRTGRMNFGVAYRRDTYFSYLSEAFYYVENLWAPRYNLYLSRVIRIDAGWETSSLDYPEPYPTAAGLIHRVDRYSNPNVGLSIRLSGDIGLSLSYNLFRRTSDIPAFNVRRNFIGGSIIFDF